jgi:Glycosyltransferase WbsX
MTDHIVNTYFRSSSYWMLDQCPYFSIYELFNFVASMGGVRPAAKAIEDFREKTRAAGFRDLHLNAVTWGVKLLPGQTEVVDLKSLLEQLQIDSTTSYVWLHHAQMSSFPVAQYDAMAKKYEEYRATASEKLGKPYFPNVSMGWDSSPRACQSDVYVKKDYPFLPVVQGNSPENFGNALRSAKSFLDNSPYLKNKVLTINSWNEWTEGSYLEPDTVNRYGYLDQIAKVFPKPKRS